MAQSGKPIWYQGMFMRPQHFQQQERYWETVINEHVAGQFGYGWGLRQLEIDQAALEVGSLHITQLAVTLPDGTPLSAPGGADLPPPRTFGGEAAGKRVMLALPIRRTDAPEVSTTDSAEHERRWRRLSVSLRDISREDEEYCEVQVGRLAPVLLLEDEVTGAYGSLPISRIKNASENALLLDDNYLPPVMNCKAHAGYMRALGDIRAILHRRAETLAKQLDPGAATGLSDMLDFLLLQMMNRHEAAFVHMMQLDHIQPERAFVATAELAAELTTFLPERRAEPPPVYDHSDPGPGWRKLVRTITAAFSLIADRHGLELPLERQANGSLVAAIHDRSLLEDARFILIVRENAPREVDQVKIENRLKVGSVDTLREIVNLQLSGIPCKTVPVVPRGLPYYPNAGYLEVDRTAPLWEEVRASASLAIYIAGGQTQCDLQLWAVRGRANHLPIASEGIQ